jgi:predicted MFS family arabinose efflux permease
MRERWMTLAQAAAMLCSGLYVWGWTELHPLQPRWAAYIVPATAGVGFLIAAIVPLLVTPELAAKADLAASLATRSKPPILVTLLHPLTNRRFLGMLAVFCWFSLVNGMVSSPQNLFPNQVLKLGLFSILALKVGMRLGQWPLGPSVGRLADRYGNRLVLALGYLIVAQAPLFYFFATPARPWWVVGAWICWIAWIGANIGMPNLLLKIAPQRSNASYIALFYAATGLCHGLSTLGGGALFDRYSKSTGLWYWGWNYYQTAFVLAWAGYLVGVVLLMIVVRANDGAGNVG